MATFEVTTDLDDGRGDGLLLLLSRRYPPWPDSVRHVRAAVAGCLQAVTAACREAVVLIALELATDVVRHVRTPYILELAGGEAAVRLDVTDLSADDVRTPPPLSPVGRHGLAIVSAVSTRWGLDWHNGYKVSWAEVSRSHGSSSGGGGDATAGRAVTPPPPVARVRAADTEHSNEGVWARMALKRRTHSTRSGPRRIAVPGGHF